MKFDTIIIGGGLSGLSAGISLVKAGQRVAVVSAGQSSLHFNSGSFELMGYDENHRPVENPLEAMKGLDEEHPYRRKGLDNVARLAPQVAPMLADAGVRMRGTAARNHWRLSPMGVMKTAWLTVEDHIALDSPDSFPWKKAAIINITGLLDFFPRFLETGLRKRGMECSLAEVTCNEIAKQRVSATEMRATNIARVLQGKALESLAAEIRQAAGDAEVIFFPSAAGLESMKNADILRELAGRPFYFIPTMSTSVSGVRCQMTLQKYFMRIGGYYMIGDVVSKGNFDGNRLLSVETRNFASDRLSADNFIFAAGSFYSHGMVATPSAIVEPVLGLDTEYRGSRPEWYNEDIFRKQPYMKFGIATDADFRAIRDGKTTENIYVAGSSLPGADSVNEGSGAGVAALTALHIAEKIK